MCWDFINFAWLIDPTWVPTAFVPTPALDEDLKWRHLPGRPLMSEATDVDRDAVYRDFFHKLGTGTARRWTSFLTGSARYGRQLSAARPISSRQMGMAFDTEVDPAGAGGLALLSIGHSTHPIEVFVELLRGMGSSRWPMCAPRRSRGSTPSSTGIPWSETCALPVSGTCSWGRKLGGRPDGDRFYDQEGHVLYGRMAESPRFESGLTRLVERAERSRVAVMCIEENPAGCHRFLLVTRVLHDRGIEVGHIRGDGSTQRTQDVDTFQAWADPVYEDVSLLDGSVTSSWGSTRPVPRGGGP